MIVYDPLYGRYKIPSYLERLVLTPEVRRLSQVRLLNTMTPSLATLGDLRRYSHTLGVLILCAKLVNTEYSVDEFKALSASVLLHDIGTPPFGHLLEYHLKENTGWTHEGIIKSVLQRTYAPENRAHQIFAGRAIEFASVLKALDIRLDLVEAIVTGQHPLSHLLFGTIDLDNLDNIARMGWALGLTGGTECAVRLASTIAVDRSSRLLLSAQERETVLRWSALRRQIYEILVFDPSTVAAQAVLSETIAIAIREDILTEEDWHLSDEQLLARLQSLSATKDAVNREYLGRLPEMVAALQISGTLTDHGFVNRAAAKDYVESVLREELEDDTPVLGYVFIDRGTFSKSLVFYDPRTSISWKEGETSSSIVLYGFVRSQRRPPAVRSRRVMERLLDRFGRSKALTFRCETEPIVETLDAQCSFNFPARQD
jgi:HD superfamily phosphohydrolase